LDRDISKKAKRNQHLSPIAKNHAVPNAVPGDRAFELALSEYVEISDQMRPFENGVEEQAQAATSGYECSLDDPKEAAMK
jgi:hypothetical protein